MPLIYGYARCSHLDSAESGLSIESQSRAIRAHVSHLEAIGKLDGMEWGTVGWLGNIKGHEGVLTDDGMFVDRAVSARKVHWMKRPAVVQLNAQVQPGDMIVVRRMDRAFRNLIDFCRTEEHYRIQGVILRLMEPDVDASTPWGKAFIQMAAIFAELESSMKADRIRECFAAARAAKRPIAFGLTVPGFHWVKNAKGKRVGVVRNRKEYAEIVEIAQLRKQGLTIRAIADEMEHRVRVRARQHSNKSLIPHLADADRRWTKHSVHLIVKSLAGKGGMLVITDDPDNPLKVRGFDEMRESDANRFTIVDVQSEPDRDAS